MGRNGVGKTTLMRRIAAGAVPGWPLHLSTAYVQQELLGSSEGVLEAMLGAGAGGAGGRARAEAERDELEDLLTDEAASPESKEARLGECAEGRGRVQRRFYAHASAPCPPPP